jgi:hypothetical protein
MKDYHLCDWMFTAIDKVTAVMEGMKPKQRQENCMLQAIGCLKCWLYQIRR